MKKSLKMLLWLLVALVALVVLYKLLRKGFEGFENSKTVTYYYLPTCPHCQDFEPEWTKFEEAAKTEGIQTNKVNGSTAGDEVAAKGIKGFPTILVKTDKETEYQGDRTSVALMAYVKSL